MRSSTGGSERRAAGTLLVVDMILSCYATIMSIPGPAPRARIAETRAGRGWSQAELARRTGLSRAEVSAIETGRVVPSVAAALALARAFACRVEDLFDAGRPTREPSPAWDPPREGGRLWQADVGGRTLLYPVEATAMGTLAHDGVSRAGRVEARDDIDPARTLVVAGCDPAAGLLAAEYARQSGFRLLPVDRPSRAALELLGGSRIHAAGVHFAAGDGASENEEVVRDLLGTGYRLLRVARWQEGVAVRPDVGLRSVGAVVRGTLRWVGREEGSAARRCMDRLLGRRAGRPAGYRRVARSHRAVAETLRTGWAQAGVCVRLAAEEAGLRFLGVGWEAYDLCFPAASEDDPRVAALVGVVRSARYRQMLADLPGYDAAGTGDVAHVA